MADFFPKLISINLAGNTRSPESRNRARKWQNANARSGTDFGPLSTSPAGRKAFAGSSAKKGEKLLVGYCVYNILKLIITTRYICGW